MSTISRQMAIEALERDEEYNADIPDRADGVRDAIITISSLPSVEPEINKQKFIRTMNAGIIATSTEDVYSCGMRNGIRWCRALLEDDAPKFEDASQYVDPERKKGKWIKQDCGGVEYTAVCSECGYGTFWSDALDFDFCPKCGIKMER